MRLFWSLFKRSIQLLHEKERVIRSINGQRPLRVVLCLSPADRIGGVLWAACGWRMPPGPAGRPLQALRGAIGLLGEPRKTGSILAPQGLIPDGARTPELVYLPFESTLQSLL